MRQEQKKKEKDKVAVVLMLCFCVIALTSIFTVKSNLDKINDNVRDVPASEENKTQPKDKQPQKQTDEVSSNIPSVDSLNPPENSPQKRFINPVKSESQSVTNPYSMDKLIYSVTLDQYMTHCGIDIEAPADSQVLAASEGTVTAVFEDDRYGTSIEITHAGGIVTIYSNLSAAEMVEVGDVVKKGQIIGGIGSTGLFEALEPAHLHLEMLKDGVYVDPNNYIDFN